MMTHLKTGLPPGSLIYTGKEPEFGPKYRLIKYLKEDYSDLEKASFDEIRDEIRPGYRNWLQISGVVDPVELEKIGEALGLDLLVLEDLINEENSVKVEYRKDYTFIVSKAINHPENTNGFRFTHLCLIVKKDLAVTFSVNPTDIFDRLIERIEGSSRKIRERGVDYLLFALLDTVVDYYLEAFYNYSSVLIKRERTATDDPASFDFYSSYREKLTHLKLKQMVAPMLGIIVGLSNREEIVSAATKPFFSDLDDHIRQANNMLEMNLESLNTLINTFSSIRDEQRNRVIQLLTIISAIFLPLTFLAGIYGMNFVDIPGIDKTWGFPALMGLMVLIGGGAFGFFKYRKWL